MCNNIIYLKHKNIIKNNFSNLLHSIIIFITYITYITFINNIITYYYAFIKTPIPFIVAKVLSLPIITFNTIFVILQFDDGLQCPLNTILI